MVSPKFGFIILACFCYATMEKRSKFIVELSMELLVSLGLNTPILLDYKAWQTSFKVITNQWLKRIMLRIDHQMVMSMKMVLGKGHLSNLETFRVNTHIVS